MPERVEFSKSGSIRNKQVTAIGKNRKDGAEDWLSVAPGGEAFASSTELTDRSEGGFGECRPSQEMNGGV